MFNADVFFHVPWPKLIMFLIINKSYSGSLAIEQSIINDFLFYYEGPCPQFVLCLAISFWYRVKLKNLSTSEIEENK